MHKNVRQHFGNRIKELRLKYGWTQEDLADKSGIGRVFVSQIDARGLANFKLRYYRLSEKHRGGRRFN
jgi:transcriptional regulator with XRE-family HTH domain